MSIKRPNGRKATCEREVTLITVCPDSRLIVPLISPMKTTEKILLHKFS
jgi:hypothetical protein